ncbi:MAG: polysaccharide biosynthesis tyrosine autokinase [Lentimicrobium sp.]|nr:polysaccharide biosynthesis tyrosine autokinase [Lentimicrobium sp.]
MKKTEEIFQQKTDYKDLVFKLWRFKHWFVIAVFGLLVAAYIFNKISSPVFKNQTTLLLKESQSNSFLTGQDMMQGFGLFGANQNIENELGVLSSYSMIYDAVNKMNLETSIYKEEFLFGNLIKHKWLRSVEEVYLNKPIQISINKAVYQPIDLPFYFTILNDQEFKIEAKGENVAIYDYIEDEIVMIAPKVNISGTYKFGDEIKGPNYDFRVHLSPEMKENFTPIKDRVYFSFNSISYMTLLYQASISAVVTSRTSSLVVISMVGNNYFKITDFLNTLANAYLERNLERKNRIAINTVKFIDSQISEVADSLSFAESKLQNFRTSNRVMDIGFQGQQSLELLSQLESERALLVVQKKYYDYIQNYFERNTDMADLIAPSSMNVQDPILNQLITQLITLNADRNSLLKQGNIKNLRLNTIEVQIANVKNTIIENISSNSATTDIALQDINNRVARINSEMSRIPTTERKLLGMERTFKLNDAIYTFLLQKRSEAQIARASNQPDYDVIDAARYITASKIFPKGSLSYIIAAVLGLVIPFVVIVLKDYLNVKISGKKEVESITSFPILGHVFTNESKDNIVINETANSPISESFRSIRTNLQFYSKGKDKQVFLITSSYTGEGKSFIAQNLAAVYALFGKKTLIIGFDLRRPKLYQDFKLNNQKGVSTVLINQTPIPDVIQSTSIKNLDFISAGPIPPNPLELIASEKTEELINELKQHYDYIIIDSPPVGVVSDAYLLMKFADVNLFVVRQGFTNREAFANNTNLLKQKNVQHVSMVINDVKAKGLMYDYGYEYTYYAENNSDSWFKSKKKNKKK